MNGVISVESTLGQGSVFSVVIPVTNQAVKPVDAELIVEPVIPISNEKVQAESSIITG